MAKSFLSSTVTCKTKVTDPGCHAVRNKLTGAAFYLFANQSFEVGIEYHAVGRSPSIRRASALLL